MNREIYFDCSFGQIRAAVMEDGVLCELHSEHNAERKLTETVFLGNSEYEHHCRKAHKSAAKAHKKCCNF